MLKVFTLKNRIIMYLANASNLTRREEDSNIRLFANQEEVREMNECHAKSVKLLEVVFDKLHHIDRGRVLEVAAGDGRVSRDLLMTRFEAIDCFDQCPVAVKQLELLQE